jgi:low temperature requirement protein LtrA
MVAGYVVMRSSMLFLWAQAARHDRRRARSARKYLSTIAVAQAGWVILVFLDLSVARTFAVAGVLLAIELAGPALAERIDGGTPWHAGHIAERYGLLIIITLGEGIIGTVASLNALVHTEDGWTLDAALVTVAGVGLTFGCWWTYFAVPWEAALRARSRRQFTWSYGHIFMFAGLAAMGGGLHVAADLLEHEAKIGVVATVLSVAIPVAFYLGALYAVYSIVMREADPFHIGLLMGTAIVVVGSVALAAAGVAMPVCLVVLMFAPIVTVIGYELVGHRHMAQALQRLNAG